MVVEDGGEFFSHIATSLNGTDAGRVEVEIEIESEARRVELSRSGGGEGGGGVSETRRDKTDGYRERQTE